MKTGKETAGEDVVEKNDLDAGRARAAMTVSDSLRRAQLQLSGEHVCDSFWQPHLCLVIVCSLSPCRLAISQSKMTESSHLFIERQRLVPELISRNERTLS